MDRRDFLAVGTVAPLVAMSLDVSSVMAGETFTSVEAAGDLHRLQGEYMGVVGTLDGTWGAQVIATSDKTLEVHLLKGGLPGDGFNSKEPTRVCKVDRVESLLAKGKEGDYSVAIDGKTLTVTDGDGKKLGELTKIMRESKTLGMEPPKGAMVLFDGTSAEKFEGGKLIDQKYLGVGCKSKDVFQDHRLHLEFRTPFQPSDSGQGRGNSGVYIQGRYELQVLDSFGLRGENNECGGIYQIASPKLNMCYPPLSWQTYDIDFKTAKFDADGKKTTNSRVTIRHNGVVIHDDLEFPRGTPGGVGGEAPEGGPLYLQDHSNPVVFRNIWVSKPE
ncbi:MAG: DUF1080 domain-containing protein [Planctomycetota bacterium]